MKLPRYYVLHLYNEIEYWFPRMIAILLMGFVLLIAGYFLILSFRAELAHRERRGEERKTRENFETFREMQKQERIKKP